MYGYKPSEAGMIPEEWNEVLLDSVARRGSGHTPDKKHPEYWDGDIKWVSLADSDSLDQGFIADTAATITPAGIAHSSAVLYPPGTVILSRDAGVGKSAIMKTAMAVSQHFMAWRCGPTLDNLFFYYWLQAEKPEFERIANGSTIKTIGLPYFRALTIPLPPVPEQRQIAEALSHADTLIQTLDKLIGKKRNLRHAAMQQLLTGHMRLPGFNGAWERKRIGDLLTYERPDQYIVKSAEYSSKGEIPVLTANKSFVLGFTTEMSGICSDVPIIIFDDFTTDTKYVAFPFKVKSSAIKILRAKTADVDLRYVFQRMQLVHYPVAGHKRHYISDYQYVSVLMPLRDEQAAIAAILSDMEAEIVALETRRQKTLALKQGMMQELLTGRTRLL